MVASSRSSLRRPTLRGDHNSTVRSTSPVAIAAALPATTSTTTNAAQSPNVSQDNLHSKRVRVSSVSGHYQLQKRRKIKGEHEADDLIQIPLRSKEVAAGEVIPAAVPTRSIPTLPTATRTSSSTNSPLESPSLQPQYDQIKRIEEKARAAIQKETSNPGHKDDRRRLRSEHGSSRAKTELAQYFPAFDDMLSLEPPDPDLLTSNTHLILVDDTPDFQPTPGHPDPFGAHKPLSNVEYFDVWAHLPAQRAVHDPLGQEVYYKAHRKAERHEKQIKNGDKERAQHEKYQLERLLDELRGPDWLKTLGITGITDTEKKRYEPKRLLLIRETKALINKFKRWKEEEKRRKLEREQALQDEMEEAEAQAAPETETTTSTSVRKKSQRGSRRVSTRSHSVQSADKAHESSEIDLLAAQQLLQEANVANVRRKKTSTVVEPQSTLVPPPPLVAPVPAHKPFTSFFTKRHIRDAAVAGRQRGRLVLAFGQPLPDMQESDFILPDSILTEDAIRASQRNRRRAKRSTDE